MPVLLRIRPVLFLLASACAANGEAAVVSRAEEPDCSFRSPTTCWTMSGRFPSRQRAADPPKERTPEEPPLLASDD